MNDIDIIKEKIIGKTITQLKNEYKKYNIFFGGIRSHGNFIHDILAFERGEEPEKIRYMKGSDTGINDFKVPCMSYGKNLKFFKIEGQQDIADIIYDIKLNKKFEDSTFFKKLDMIIIPYIKINNNSIFIDIFTIKEFKRNDFFNQAKISYDIQLKNFKKSKLKNYNHVYNSNTIFNMKKEGKACYTYYTIYDYFKSEIYGEIDKKELSIIYEEILNGVGNNRIIDYKKRDYKTIDKISNILNKMGTPELDDDFFKIFELMVNRYIK